MAKVSQARMYSWWWDSHISPKNSKWLQENLTEMDASVKAMIKLIEEDADSFARRAEMYYKKRPELMKLVEEFYRAYRALAERYDNATGVLRQAHRTMAEAFPNQVPILLGDDSPASSASQSDPRTPDMPPPTRLLFDQEDSQMEASGPSSSHLHSVKRNGGFSEESDSSTSRKGLKQLNNTLFSSGDSGRFAEGRVRKGLNFHEKEEKERRVQSKENEQMGKYEEEIKILKEALSKLEAEKEAGLVQYRQSLERLSNLESEVSRAQEDSRGLNERASKAEADVQNLNEALTKLEVEREASLLQYQQCLEKISNLESFISSAKEDAGELNERASKAETEAQVLTQELATVLAEKDTALDQYKHSLEMISNLEKKILLAEEDARKINERAEKAESEVENLKEALAKLTEEKEAAALQYQQCLETISSLENKISFAQEEAQRLNGEIDDGVTKLKGAEERCVLLERSNQSLHSELESVVLKMGTQTQELTENQEELGKLWTCIQEERLRFVEAETAFQTLQHLHAQAQEELRSLASELQNRALILRDMETRNQSLQDEVLKVKEENKHLDELNLSSSMTIKDMRDEIFGLRETKGKLEEEVHLRVDQRNALQQEIYCLKEELNELNKKHSTIVKELQEENSILKETCERERSEKVALLEKLEIMEQLLEKNALLENSLSDLSAELEEVRGKMRTLEESFQSLLNEKTTLAAEKATLVTHLQVTTENLEKLSAKNTFLENSLSDAHVELDGLKATSKSLEDLCQVLDKEKSALISQKDTLVSQLNISQQQFEELEKRYTDLEEKYLGLEKEKELAFRRVEELQVFLNNAKHEHASFTQLSETRLAGMETQIRLLQEEGRLRRREFEEELDKAMGSQIEIFILQRCVKDLEGKRYTELEEKYSGLEKEKELAFCRVEELQVFLNNAKHEHASFTQLSETRLAGMETQIRLLQEEGRLRRREFEEELDKTMGSQIEIFVLQRCVKDLEENNLSLLIECQKLSKASKFSEKLISEIQEENLEKQAEVKSLVDQTNKLKRGLYQLLKVLNIDDKNGQEQSYLNHILLKLEESIICVCKTQDENQELAVQNSVLVTLLGQLRSEAESLQLERNSLDKEYRMKTEHFSLLQSEARELLELNEALRLKVKEGGQKEEVLITQMENLHGKLLDLERAHQNLQEENSNVLEEKRSLMEEFVELGEKNCTLEEESCVLFGEKLLLSSLSLIFENFVNEKSVELKEVGEDIEKLRCINSAFEEKLRITERKLEEVEMDNFHLKEALKKSEDEFKTRLFVTEFEKSELQIIVEDLKQEHDEVELIRKNQEKQIFELCEENGHLSEENGCLCEANWKLEVKVQQLHEENEKGKNREEDLYSELQKGKKEIDMWETEASALFGELQFSSVCQALFESKIHEFTEAYESLEDEHTVDIKVLKEKVGSLEGENGGLKAQLAAYIPTVMSLRDCISSLENQSCLRSKLRDLDNAEAKDCEMVSNLNVKSSASESQSAMVPDAFSDLQDLQTRIKAIEKALIEENLDANAKLEAAIKQIEELKFKNSSPIANSTSEISETENGLLTKDIMLDQISECSSYGRGRRDYTENDNQMLELWETIDKKDSIDLTVGKAKKGANPTSENLVEKELAVDKLEISKRSSEPRKEENQRKVLERLNSDVQKLTNLRITVQDLKRKVETTEKSKKGKAIVECDAVKGQLEEAEEAILKLFDQNGKLMKNIEDSSFSSDGKFEMESEEREGIRRKRTSEQARRVSDKIGRLQLEIQKIQFVLLKLDDEREIKGKASIPETKRRVLLRDYLYGGGRSTPRRKKGHFCSCVQPPTKGD